MTQTQVTGRTAKSEVLGEWTTDHGNRLTLMARRATGYASIWLNHHGKPVKIGHAVHAGGVLRSFSATRYVVARPVPDSQRDPK